MADFYDAEIRISSDRYVPADEMEDWLRHLLRSHNAPQGATIDKVRVTIDYSSDGVRVQRRVLRHDDEWQDVPDDS